MANNRVYNAQALKVVTPNITIGGLATVGISPSYRDIVQSRGDGAAGVEDVDRCGLRVGTNFEVSDVTKANAILDAAESNVSFSGKVSASTNWHHVVLSRNNFVGMNLNFPFNGDASMQLNGVLRATPGVGAGSSTENMSALVAITENTSAPTVVYPSRLYRPFGVSLGSGGSPLTPLHLQSVQLSLTAEVLEDYGDRDVAVVAVDRLFWNPLQVTLTFRDHSQASGVDMCSQIMQRSREVMSMGLTSRAAATTRTLTIQNVLWTGSPTVTKGRDYWEFSVTGMAAWKNGATVYTMNATDKLFEFSAAA